MFRHVVLFKWSDEAGEDRRAAAVSALRAWAADAAVHGRVTVGTDAGIREGNFDVAVVAEFDGPEGYQAYSADPRHVTLLRDHITPNVATRAAVQHAV